MSSVTIERSSGQRKSTESGATVAKVFSVNRQIGSEKPPPVPVKRKKKVEKSFENLMGQTKMDLKRAKMEELPVVATKPPIPPKPDKLKLQNQGPSAHAKDIQNRTLLKLKRKSEETNQALVSKLNCYIEQMRLEIHDLKTSLVSEKNAVRALRAQHDAVNRKLKADAKKCVEPTKKAHTKSAAKEEATKSVSIGIECSILTEQPSSKLNQEIITLKDTNKSLEEKIQITSEAEKRTSADIHELKDSYELRLTQITKSAKVEIHRLLDEIKTKDKTIRQLQKEMLKKDSKKTASTVMRKDAATTTTAIAIPSAQLTTQTNTTTGGTTALGGDGPYGPSSLLLASRNSSDQQLVFPKDLTYVDGLRNELEFVQHENEILKSEIESAKEQIGSLEKALIMVKEGSRSEDTQPLVERIRQLEHKESDLIKETHELREQNDLLEFRIVELEESQMWSLRSNPNTRDMWTDTEKEPDDMMMMSERSDSGVTSPHSNHQLEDRISLPSPCDLSMIDNIPSDDIRKRIMAMTKRSCYDDEDKICLMQILSLLNNLEALSQDHEITGEFMSLDSSTPIKVNQEKSRIVATVQPYNNSDHSGGVCEEPIKPQLQLSQKALPSSPMTGSSTNKAKFWTSLQESGVFDEQVIVNQCTQTYPEDFPNVEKLSGDLTAEIQKLNKFRERIEECVSAKNPKVNVVTLLSPEQRKLEYYKERLEILESKLMIYESSDDIQLRKLADRLQKEIQLEATVKQLKEKIGELQSENQILDEERCEFEEAENDTRLKFQRLEVDFEILTQRNVELEMNEEGLQNKLKEAKRQIALLEERISQLKSRIEFLEVQEAIPSPAKTKIEIVATGDCSETEQELRDKLSELLNREREMQQNIDELKRAYNETLENADNVWAEMENDYKNKLKKCEFNEVNLQGKLAQLEDRIKSDSQFAQERLHQMEELESNLKNRISKLNRDNKELTTKYTTLLDEFNSLKEEYSKLKAYLSGPAAEILDRERRKVKTLEDDMKHTNQMLKQLEDKSKESSHLLKTKMMAAIKELENIKITNNELQEEVVTLEARIMELRRMKVIDEETIKNLTEELKMKQKQLMGLQSAIHRNPQPPTLAQELGSSHPVLTNFTKPKTTPEDTKSNLKGVKRMADTFMEQNGKPKILPKPEDIGRFVTKV